MYVLMSDICPVSLEFKHYFWIAGTPLDLHNLYAYIESRSESSAS